MAKNAITMTGDIEKCWLFVYRIPTTQLEPILPNPLMLFTKAGYGFLNVVVSDLSHMRPKGLPSWLGMSYRHVAYRIHCRFEPKAHCQSGRRAGPPATPCRWPDGGEPIEGLYFLRSDADSRLMAAAGNFLTDFRFHFADIQISDSEVEIRSNGGNGKAVFDLTKAPVLAPGASFATLSEAERELKYKPAAFFVHPKRVDVLRIGRDESSWRSKLLAVKQAEFEFLKPFDATLEVCYKVEPIRYIWKRAERFPI